MPDEKKQSWLTRLIVWVRNNKKKASMLGLAIAAAVTEGFSALGLPVPDPLTKLWDVLVVVFAIITGDARVTG